MARTSSVLVKGIIEVDDSITVDPFIDTANQLVTELCEPLDYSETRLELIERWLSAHFVAIRDQRRQMERADTVSEMFQYKLGLRLESTMYGQQVLMLDTQLALAALNNSAGEVKRWPSGAAIGVTFLGSVYPEDELDDL